MNTTTRCAYQHVKFCLSLLLFPKLNWKKNGEFYWAKIALVGTFYLLVGSQLKSCSPVSCMGEIMYFKCLKTLSIKYSTNCRFLTEMLCRDQNKTQIAHRAIGQPWLNIMQTIELMQRHYFVRDALQEEQKKETEKGETDKAEPDKAEPKKSSSEYAGPFWLWWVRVACLEGRSVCLCWVRIACLEGRSVCLWSVRIACSEGRSCSHVGFLYCSFIQY